jgi:hypothetical protein
MTKQKEVFFMFKFQMWIAGQERKKVVGLIAGHFGTQSVYQGAPSFGYLIAEPGGREWLIDKAGILSTRGLAKGDIAEMFAVLKTLGENGAVAEGQAAITISTEGHDGVTLRNIINILVAKERLIVKATGVDGQPIIAQGMVEAINSVRLKTDGDFLEVIDGEDCPGVKITKDTISFHWFAATLNPEVIQAYIQLAFAVNKMALAQKHSTPHETETANEKYTFRVWLLRLGFIGEEYKVSRKLLLERLSGNGSFRTRAQAEKAAKKRKKNKNG